MLERMEAWRARAGTLALLIGLAAGCAAPPVQLPDEPPGPAPCRQVVDADGRVVDRDVTWHEAPDAADRARLDAACRTVGPIVVSQPMNEREQRPWTELVAVTWNVHGGAGNVRALVQAITEEGPAETAARNAADPAQAEPRPAVVLLLQEAYRAGARIPADLPPGAPVPRAVRPGVPWREDVVSIARALDWYLVYVPSMRNGRAPGPDGPEDRGTAILSTVPLEAIAVVELPFARHRRAAVVATAAGGASGVRVRVVSLHLDTVGSWRTLYLFSSWHRAGQAAHVVDVLGPANSVVLGADLNTWSEGPAEGAVARLRRAFDDTPPPRWQPTYGGLWRLDYFFFRLPEGWTTGVRRVPGMFGSDHHPLVAEIVAR